MEIEKDIGDKVISYYNYIKENNDTEFEVLIKSGSVSRYEFISVLQYFRSIKAKSKFEDETLSINFKYKNIPYRYEINGKQNINIYCMTNNISKVSNAVLMSKSWIQGKYPISIDDYGLKVNLKQEQIIDMENQSDLIKEINKNLYTLKKVFRLKKRFSFFSDDDIFRFDITIVKSSINDDESNIYETYNLFNSGILLNEESYEIEIEFLRPEDIKKAWVDNDTFVNKLFTNCGLILMILSDDDYIMSETKRKQVINRYKKLCEIQNDGKVFIGPMPVTLEMKNLLKPDLGINSILEDYTVTDKADGERHLLYIDSDGKAYLINNRLFVRYTGVRCNDMINTILDGEYITQTKSNVSIKLFMSFDIYYYKGSNITQLPLIAEDEKGDDRKSKMDLVVKANFTGDTKFQLLCKDFLYEKNIFKSSKTILEKEVIGNMLYEIDGLIFTPRYLPVGGLYKDSKPVLGGTWVKVFKWKPPEQNTIDFLVITEKNNNGSDIVEKTADGYFKILNLYVGYDVLKTQKINPYDFLTGNLNLEEGYKSVRFQPSGEIYENISVAKIILDKNNVMRAKSGEIINDGFVVEFAYTDNTWIPNRLRKDKTMGNDFTTAVNIWRSINNPVTEDIITGKQKIKIDDSEAFDSDVYYNRLESRDNSASKAMLNFHNYWVKNMNLIAKFRNKATSVFDIGCGKGGDRDKYIKAGFTTIVGIDKSEDNIYNPIDGAYKRLYNDMKSKIGLLRDDTKIVFLPLDCSNVINQDSINNMKEDEIKKIFQVLWGMKTEEKLSKYYELVKNRFDVVSCQFAIHYFFENPTSLNALIMNIASVIKEGGYFIGTCLDGIEVDKQMRDNDIGLGGSISGKLDDRVLWDIRKDYKVFDNKDSDKNYGLKIDVYIETINKRVTEYIVDFRLLEKELAKYDIRPLNNKECKELNVTSSSGSFKELFKLMKSSSVKSYHIKSATEMSDQEQHYSFMNRWFIFKKDSTTPKTSKIISIKTETPLKSVTAATSVTSAASATSSASSASSASPQVIVKKRGRPRKVI
jgi:mRNA (guanine-N7-)-methyltransferase